MYNGDSSNSTVIEKYCGSSLPPDFISSTNRAFIHFHSDNSGTVTGFELEYRAISGKLVQLHTGCVFYKDDNVPYYSLKLSLEAINISMYSTQKGTILNELYAGKNRYKQFKDKQMSCMRGRRGSNQNEEPYLGENVLPQGMTMIDFRRAWI